MHPAKGDAPAARIEKVTPLRPPEDLDLAVPEWEAFTRPGPIELPDFTTKKERPPSSARPWLREVALVPRLREVSALYGFTRIDAPEWDILSTEEERILRLARGPPPGRPPAPRPPDGHFPGPGRGAPRPPAVAPT